MRALQFTAALLVAGAIAVFAAVNQAQIEKRVIDQRDTTLVSER
jgi:hypothetical protein